MSKFDPIPFVNLHQNPMFIMEHQQRSQQVYQIGNQLKKLSKLIKHYTQVGNQFCQGLRDISHSLNEFEIIYTNPECRNFTNSIFEISEVLQNHFAQVENENGLKKFAKKEFSSFVEAEKTQAKELERFYTTQEKLLGTSKTTAQSGEKYTEYKKAYESSCLSFYDFVVLIDETEAKITNLILSFLTKFSSSLSNTFEYTSKKATETNSKIREDGTIVTTNIMNLIANDHQNRNTVLNLIPERILTLNNTFSCEAYAKQGYLWRKRGKLTKTWEKLFFVCMNGTMSASENPKDAHNPQITFPLKFVSVQPNINEDRLFVFNLITKNKVWVLQAPSQYDYDEWISAIRTNIANVLYNESPIKKTITFNNNPKNNERKQYVCADCGKVDVTWYVMNKNLTLCDQCAGVHRAMANISVVRSLKLDTIDPYNLHILNMFSDNKMNEFYENTIGQNKINESTQREEREEFIHKKYVDKLFMRQLDNVPNPFNAIQNQNPMDLFVASIYGNLNVRKKGKFLPIHAAACVGNPLLISIIALNSNQINKLDKNGWSPLSYAAYFKNIAACNALCEFGANVNASSVANPLVIATQNKCSELIAKFSNGSEAQPTETEPIQLPKNVTFKPIDIPQDQVVDINKKEVQDVNNIEQEQRIERAISRMSRRNTVSLKKMHSFKV